MAIHATCKCTSAVLIRAGSLVCASCGAPVASDEPARSAPTTAPTTYGSRPPHAAPPGKSHRWLREHGQELLAYGAERRGGKRGRDVLWLISSEGYARFIAAQREFAEPSLPEAAPEQSNVVDLDAFIAGAGYRLTGGRR